MSMSMRHSSAAHPAASTEELSTNMLMQGASWIVDDYICPVGWVWPCKGVHPQARGVCRGGRLLLHHHRVRPCLLVTTERPYWHKAILPQSVHELCTPVQCCSVLLSEQEAEASLLHWCAHGWVCSVLLLLHLQARLRTSNEWYHLQESRAADKAFQVYISYKEAFAGMAAWVWEWRMACTCGSSRASTRGSSRGR